MDTGIGQCVELSMITVSPKLRSAIARSQEKRSMTRPKSLTGIKHVGSRSGPPT